ncbi:Hypothetical predicted protein [Olea europaea subsp. europaea]|uniref:DUF1985 domain-containing protein n=1 Tax=Olea europaea subsp. europaea TaxID=158383 RepID=A0A8S0U698_OLEEU|nr:Hypothetical predicted protein [Olea europaea subsp. europaea]
MGLRASEESLLEPHIVINDRLVKKHFKKCKKGITVYNLKEAIKSRKVCMEDKYKIGLVYILETILLPKESYTYINLEHLSMVDDLETFNSYLWGRKVFGCTIDVFMRDWKSLMKSYSINNEKYQYSIYGFSLALQIWAYKAIPSIGQRYGENLREADLPRICRWNSFEMPNSKDIGARMDKPNIVHCTLKPTSKEASKAYWTEIHRFEDEVDDPTVDIFVDKENVADSSVCVDFPQQTCQFPNASTSPRDPSFFHRPPTSTDAHTFHLGPSTSYPSLYPFIDEFAQELKMQLLQMVEILERKNEGRIDEMRSYIDQSGFMNTGEVCDVNEDPLVHQNDKNEDGNEEREVEDYVLANEPVLVKEATSPADGNEQKQADDMNNCPNPIEVENE